MQQHTQKQKTLWTVGLAAVVIASLVPVVWLLMLSLKTPATVGDGRFIPKEFTFENYEALFKGGLTESPFLQPLINSILIALIATTIAITLAAFTATRSPAWTSRASRSSSPARWRSRCSRRSRSSGPLFDMWRALGIYDTYLGLIIPYLTFALRWRSTRSSRSSARSRSSSSRPPRSTARRRRRPSARSSCRSRAGHVHRGDPRLHLLLERLPVRDHADVLEGGRADRPGRAGVLHGRVAVHRADRARSPPRRSSSPSRSSSSSCSSSAGSWPASPLARSRARKGADPMAEIKLEGVSKRFPDGFEAVKSMDLTIADGEFMILVGPSAAGSRRRCA
jgi:hypothetical protein